MVLIAAPMLRDLKRSNGVMGATPHFLFKTSDSMLYIDSELSDEGKRLVRQMTRYCMNSVRHWYSSFWISTAIFLTFCLVGFLGCSYDDSEGEFETLNMPIKDIEVFISEDRPAQVTFRVTGSHNNTCVSPTPNLHQNQEGNTIWIYGTMEVCHFCTCGAAVTEVYGDISIGELAVGEYKVVSGGVELLAFRITNDASFVIRKPVI